MAHIHATNQRKRTWVRRLPQKRLVEICTLLAALVIAPGAAGCAQSSASRPATATPPPQTATPSDAALLPRFADWRAAYLSGDGSLHAASLDGKADISGLKLPDLTSHGLIVSTARFAPDGRTLAYWTDHGVTIVDLSPAPAGGVQEVSLNAADDMAWSPGGTLAAGDREGDFFTMRPPDYVPAQVPTPATHTVDKSAIELVGWIDEAHLAVTVLAGGPVYTDPQGNTWGTETELGALDIATGALRLIATISDPGLATPAFAVAPDGKTVLFYNFRLRDNPYTPLVELIDVATGRTRPLPGIVRATGAGFTSLAWQPGTMTIAVSTGYLVNNALHTWLLDAQHDTARGLVDSRYVRGWAPGEDNALVVGTALDASEGDGPHELDVATLAPGGQATLTTLTSDAMTFPFLGFVRTA